MYNQDMVELYQVSWRPQAKESFAPGDVLTTIPTAHASALAYQGTVKTPSKPVGAYRPPGARGTSTPLHFKREDEGGAAHVVGNGTSLVGANGFGRPRRQIPGAEVIEVPGAPAPEASDENLSKAALKNKKKREAKKAKDAENKAAGLIPEGGNGGESRSPDRRERSHSKGHRSPSQLRNRSNTHRGQNGGPPSHGMNNLTIKPNHPVAAAAVETPELSVTSPGGSSPAAKKLRSLQKKVRAIEDLEMRLAGGEKLEDTQMKKIATKGSVQKELDVLESEL